MSNHDFALNGTALTATATGALWIEDTQTLCVSDLHLGKSGRIARRSGTLIPPYETQDTLSRLGDVVAQFNPKTVLCLGDSFDDLDAAQELPTDATAAIAQLQAGRRWIWIEGNHDAGPVDIGGTHMSSHTQGTLCFRHIATDAQGEVSGHYHPKHRIAGAGPARSCFLYDKRRLIMPAFGTYTGGLRSTSDVLKSHFIDGAIAVLTGKRAIAVPMR